MNEGPMNDFRTNYKQTRAGNTWYRQSKYRWVTAPDGWELYLTDGPSWYLFGIGEENTGTEVCLGTRRVKEAMDEAAREIAKRQPAG